MLGALLFFGALSVSGLLCAKEDYETKKDKYQDSYGNTYYYDRLGRRYINGERIYEKVNYDKYGNRHCYTIGEKSKHIYGDSFDQELEAAKDMDDFWLKISKEKGLIVYNKYDPRFRQRVTTEIETGRVITCLFRNKNEETGEVDYRKFYFKDNNPTKMHPKFTEPGDYGIKITKEEYDKLNDSSGSFTRYPTDIKVFKDLMGIKS